MSDPITKDSIVWLRNDPLEKTYTRAGELPKGTRFVLLQILKPVQNWRGETAEWTRGFRRPMKEAISIIESAIEREQVDADGYRIVPAPSVLSEDAIVRLNQLKARRKRERENNEDENAE